MEHPNLDFDGGVGDPSPAYRGPPASEERSRHCHGIIYTNYRVNMQRPMRRPDKKKAQPPTGCALNRTSREASASRVAVASSAGAWPVSASSSAGGGPTESAVRAARRTTRDE